MTEGTAEKPSTRLILHVLAFRPSVSCSRLHCRSWGLFRVPFPCARPFVRAQLPYLRTHPPGRNMTRAKKYTGSIYDPKHISVQLHQIAQWPLPFPLPTAYIASRQPATHLFFQAANWPVPPTRVPPLRAVKAQPLVDVGGKKGETPPPTSKSVSPDSSPFYPRFATTFHPGNKPNLSEPVELGIIVRDTPRGIARNSTFAVPTLPRSLQRSDSYKRKSVPSLSGDLADGTVPPRPRPSREPASHMWHQEAIPCVRQPPADPANARTEPPISPRPDHIVRRETDPLIAIDPDVSASARDGKKSPEGKIAASRRVTRLSTPDSDSSMYSTTERDGSLFFSTPIQSPSTYSDLTFPRKASWTYLEGTGLQAVAEVDGVQPTDPAVTRSVMASLWRVTRDAGVEIDPSRLSPRTPSVYTGLRVSRDSLYSATGSFQTVRGIDGGGQDDRLQKRDHDWRAPQGRFHKGGVV
jgi:hypothetical protein